MPTQQYHPIALSQCYNNPQVPYQNPIYHSTMLSLPHLSQHSLPNCPFQQPTRPRERSPCGAIDIMRKWKIQFSGAKSEHSDSFLMRLEEGKTLTRLQDNEIFSSIPFFLTGVALLWYRTKREEWRTFDDFTRAFRERFGAPDFQYALVEEIHRRTQGYNEPVSDYLTCIRG